MTPSAKFVSFDDAAMWVEPSDGRIPSVPFAQFAPRLSTIA